MRVVVCAVLSASLALGCGGKKSSSSTAAPAGARFLPPSAEVLVRVDLTRTRAWAHFATLAEGALVSTRTLLDNAKAKCNLDVIGEASTIVFARKGPLIGFDSAASGGDATLIVGGLPKAKVTACLQAIAKDAPGAVVVDGDLAHLKVGDRTLASAAVLASGEVVVVARNGAGVAPDAWKAEVAGGGSAPAYWGELDASDPIAVRVADDKRTLTASAKLADPLVLKGKIVASNADVAKEDVGRLKAIQSYLSSADAGTTRIEEQGTTVFADLTATGKQTENLLAMVIPALFGVSQRDVVADATSGPGDCSLLPAAVEKYIGESMAKAPEVRRKQLEGSIATMVPALQKAFVDVCTADTWTASVVACHVDNATALARFEQCRQMLSAAQRDHLDKELTSALTATAPAPSAATP